MGGKANRKSRRKEYTESGMFILAPHLFEIAKAAYERTKGSSPEREIQSQDPLVAIVFSAAALEAFINEAAILAEQPLLTGVPEEPDSVGTFAELIGEMERTPVELKFMVTRAVFAEQVYDKGAQPYQDFGLLIELRNALLHLRPRDIFEFSPVTGMSVQPPKIIHKLRSKNILARPEAVTGGPWIRWISTPAAARWACNVAAKMVHSVMEVVPEGQFKNELELSYGSYSKHFRPVE